MPLRPLHPNPTIDGAEDVSAPSDAWRPADQRFELLRRFQRRRRLSDEGYYDGCLNDDDWDCSREFV